MNDFQNAIRTHLEKRAQEDSQFAEKYRAKMEADKNSIIQCCSYIIQEVKRMNVEVLTHSEVYGMAAHIFDEGVKVVGTVKCKVVVSRADMTPEEIESIKAEARETAKREILEEEVKAEKERIRKEEEKAARKAEEAAKKLKEKEDKARLAYEQGAALFLEGRS